MITIELRGLELHGHHGVLEEEAREGQRFLFDIMLSVQSPAPTTDRIEDAVDYRDVVALVREISEGRRFNLLEALAQATADALVRRFELVHAHVKVRKPDVDLGAAVEYAAVVATASASAEPSS